VYIKKITPVVSGVDTFVIPAGIYSNEGIIQVTMHASPRQTICGGLVCGKVFICAINVHQVSFQDQPQKVLYLSNQSEP
jgi:hypothetical protein